MRWPQSLVVARQAEQEEMADARGAAYARMAIDEHRHQLVGVKRTLDERKDRRVAGKSDRALRRLGRSTGRVDDLERSNIYLGRVGRLRDELTGLDHQ